MITFLGWQCWSRFDWLPEKEHWEIVREYEFLHVRRQKFTESIETSANLTQEE